jgi:hypothetical protein
MLDSFLATNGEYQAHAHQSLTTSTKTYYKKYWGPPGIEPGTSVTLRQNHATRPRALMCSTYVSTLFISICIPAKRS